MSNSGMAQVELVDEIKISNLGLHFDGSKVPESERLTFPNRAKYDFAFGSRITPHGDCIYKYKEYVFMTWYKGGESNRHVMLSRYNTNTKKTVTIQFPHRHTGFQNRPHIGESHNTIAVGIAPTDGTVHLLYDMHAYSRTRPSNGSLRSDYFRYSYSKKNVATLPDNEFTLDKFFPKRLYLKNGDNYEGLTYPRFFNNEVGDLFVSMRKGGNNNGKYMTAKYNGTSWSSFKDFNVLNARSKGISYNWGLYGDFKFINGKMHIGFHTRRNINNDKFSLNNGFYYAYANNSNNLTDWRDHKNRSIATPVIDPQKIFISEPGNEVSSSGANSVKISSGADWTVTENGSIHFRTRVIGPNGSKNVHTYKKAGENNFRTSTNFPGGDFHSIGNDVFLIGLKSGRPVVYRANAGTNNWETLYTTNSGKTFRHGVVHIRDGMLYYYLMEKRSGSAQPIYLQIYDLGVENQDNKPPIVSLTNPSQDNQEFTLGETITLSANASDPDGNLDYVNFKVNGSFFKQDQDRPFSVTWNPTVAGTYTIGARAFDKEELSTEVTRTVIIREEIGNQSPNVSFATPSNNITVQEGYDLTIVANASDPDGSISNVRLYINNSLIRQENVAPYEWGHDGSPNLQEVNGRSAGEYTVTAVATDNEGKKGEATFILTVQGDDDNGGDGDGDNNCSFGTPVNSGLAAMYKVTYSNVHVLGDDGAKLGNFRKFTINWVPANNGLYQFAFNTNNGAPDWYVDFKNTMTYQLKNAQPEIILNNTGFEGLDGSYWVTRDGNNFVLVSKTKDFSLYFNNSSSAPTCSDRSNTSEIPDDSQIVVFPNPVNDNVLNISGMDYELSSIEVVDMLGKIIIHKEEQTNDTQLNVSTLPTGTYVLIIKSLKSRKSMLFTKQ
ncbi:Ig-like domain-containing protein [Aquimarina sp. BL5]|uniref:Ig-like domain-containing protein n=1 Tax=Aquimarina sp. BL5 TaxID=1714860 RepID=UPI00131421C0|nr:Ig-like domain-containing protein [Aquimarina sp. BL5]